MMSAGVWIVGLVGLIAFLVLCWLGMTDEPDIFNRPKRRRP